MPWAPDARLLDTYRLLNPFLGEVTAAARRGTASAFAPTRACCSTGTRVAGRHHATGGSERRMVPTGADGSRAAHVPRQRHKDCGRKRGGIMAVYARQRHHDGSHRFRDRPRQFVPASMSRRLVHTTTDRMASIPRSSDRSPACAGQVASRRNFRPASTDLALTLLVIAAISARRLRPTM